MSGSNIGSPDVASAAERLQHFLVLLHILVLKYFIGVSECSHGEVEIQLQICTQQVPTNSNSI